MAALVPKGTLEDIRHRSDVVDVIGAYLTLKRAGSSFKALCPFHKEKTPSFHVNPGRQSFHCFGCGAGGDVFKFIMEHESVDFMTAVKMLAERAGIPIELEEGKGDGTDKAALYKIHEEVARFFHRCLLQMTSAAKAREYCAERDLTPEILDDFLIGYAPNRWDTVLQWGRKNKCTPDLLEKAGLVIRKEGVPEADAHYYDRFRNRLMFPIRDEQSRVIAFSGRILTADEKAAKYVNSPETPLFRKGRVLYALDKARRPIVEAREAIICEGQIDVIRCHQAGFSTAVAAQGTAFTDDHSRILKRYADSVVIVFDTDHAGEEAAVKAAGFFMDAGLAVRVAMLPPKQDPDSFIRRQGADAFRQVLDVAGSAVSFQVAAMSRHEDPASEIGAMRIAKGVLETINHSPNAVQRAKLVREASERLGIPATALQEEMLYLRRRQQLTGARAAETAPSAAKRKQPREEVELCEHLVHVIDHPELVSLVQKHLPLDMLSDPLCRAVAEAALTSSESARDILAILREREDFGDEAVSFAAALQMTPSKIVGSETSRTDAVRDIILFIWRREFKRECSDVDKRQLTTQEEESQDGNLRLQSAQLRNDAQMLRHWDTGSAIIEIKLAERAG